MFDLAFIFRPKDRKLLFGRELVEIYLPKNISKIDIGFFPTRYISAPIFLIKSNGVNIIKAGIIGKYFQIHKYSIPQYSGKRKLFIKQYLYNVVFRSRIRIKSTITVIHNPWCPGYYHWITEALCRLYLLEKNTQINVKIVLPEYYKSFSYVIDSTKCLTKKEIIYFDEKSYIKTSVIEYISNPDFTGNYNPDIIREMRNAIIKSTKTKQTKRNKRIYVSRAKAKSRHIQNEKELLNLLIEYGFQTVFFEDLNFSQQVELMQETNCLISIHGAGLTNLLFLPEGSDVLELQKEPKEEESFSILFFKLASICNVNYYYQMCKAVDDSQSIYDSDIVVDLGKLEQNLMLIFKKN